MQHLTIKYTTLCHRFQYGCHIIKQRSPDVLVDAASIEIPIRFFPFNVRSNHVLLAIAIFIPAGSISSRPSPPASSWLPGGSCSETAGTLPYPEIPAHCQHIGITILSVHPSWWLKAFLHFDWLVEGLPCIPHFPQGCVNDDPAPNGSLQTQADKVSSNGYEIASYPYVKDSLLHDRHLCYNADNRYGHMKECEL